MRSASGFCDLRISGKTREVFAFLALNANRTIRRATLSNLIWSESEERRSRANLNTALWRINRALKVVGNEDIRLHVSAHQLKLAVAPCVFIDVLALDAAVRDAAASFNDGGKALLAPGVRDTLSDVLADEHEGFLEDMSSEWVLVERERIFNLQIRGLTFLMQDLAESGRIEGALEFGRRILRMDPMRECVQRQVMWLHVLSGHQANAIRQYRECAKILQSELGVAPMPETRALYEFMVTHIPVPTDAASDWRRPARTAALAERIASDSELGGYDAELTRLRSLMSLLNSHRQSVFSALAGSGTT